MRRDVAVAPGACPPVVVPWPALDMCATYLAGPSAAGTDGVAVRCGSIYSAGHSLGRHAYVQRGPFYAYTQVHAATESLSIGGLSERRRERGLFL